MEERGRWTWQLTAEEHQMLIDEAAAAVRADYELSERLGLEWAQDEGRVAA